MQHFFLQTGGGAFGGIADVQTVDQSGVLNADGFHIVAVFNEAQAVFGQHRTAHALVDQFHDGAHAVDFPINLGFEADFCHLRLHQHAKRVGQGWHNQRNRGQFFQIHALRLVGEIAFFGNEVQLFFDDELGVDVGRKSGVVEQTDVHAPQAQVFFDVNG